MKLTLRDLFWLIFLAAVAVSWGVQHHRAQEELATQRNNHWFTFDRNKGPTPESLRRRQILKELREFNDQDLLARFNRSLQQDRTVIYTDQPEYSCCLTEMATRGLSTELELHLKEKTLVAGSWVPENTTELTALRRAQGKPDPLKITVGPGAQGPGGYELASHRIEVLLQNVDVDNQLVHHVHSQERNYDQLSQWRVELKDVHDQPVPNSNYVDLVRGGTSYRSHLQRGETEKYHFDVRKYVAPPATGRYRLQVILGSERDYIEYEPDLTGLIVIRSEPVWVDVVNHGHWDERYLLAPPLVLLSAASLFVVATTVAGLWRRRLIKTEDLPPAKFAWRDWLGWSLAIILLAGWLIDVGYLRTQLAERDEREAHWTMKLANP
ncbi:hypothetical protein ETAA8_12030 [Anatilimnocola aggregata]|uniref:Uncharacterized protein n=1 Tax=Anatilimnocola aggregata TaxID=2528021 RepID=A0A517Y7D1_9BACT|nr:hypothetical protein [Anatilimnocola aggregata]QDU26129.1 hypothetical protein ETAA8_12030 [Anatilimnocola aggregata]